jgi:hypothetical protein
MVCAFDGPPRIVRLHGAARVVLAGTPAFGALVAQARFAEVTIAEARRAVIDVAVTRVAQSCGYGVPLMTHTGEREHYDRHKRGRLRVMGRDGLLRHQTTQNARSLDGLPALAPDGVGSHPAAATAGSGGGGPGHDRTQAHDAGGPVTGTAIDERELIRDLESLGSVLADDSFGEELYRALANTRWSKADGPDGHLSLSWNRAEGVVNQLREREGQEPLTLSQTGGEGEVSDRVAHELGRLGWSAGSRDTGRDDPAHQSAGRRPPPDTPEGTSWEEQAHADADRTQGAE